MQLFQRSDWISNEAWHEMVGVAIGEWERVIRALVGEWERVIRALMEEWERHQSSKWKIGEQLEQ